MAANPVSLPISVDEYLHSVYEPDMDYVDGYLEDRNLGEISHWRVQRALYDALRPFEELGGFYVVQETRTQISLTRFRIPDTCLLPADKLPKRIIIEPPLLCIEVLSPEDRLSRMRVKCQDYLRMGVPEVWIVDPERKAVTILRPGSEFEVYDGTLTICGVELPLVSLFPEQP